MEKQYLFEAEKFGLSEKSIHLLRNRFNYKSIRLTEIDSIYIEDGKDLKNWIWVLSIGILLLAFVAYDINNILLILNDENTYHIYLERFLIPIFPFLLGGYTIFISLRNSKVMKIYSGNSTYYFSLRKLMKSNEYKPFITHLQKVYQTAKIK
jgi:hypothetical protein